MPYVKKTPANKPKEMVVASNEPTDKVIDVSNAAFFIEPGRCYIGNVVLEGMSEQGTIHLIGAALTALTMVTPRQKQATLETDAPLNVEIVAKQFQPPATPTSQLFKRNVIVSGSEPPLARPDDDKPKGQADDQEAIPF